MSEPMLEMKPCPNCGAPDECLALCSCKGKHWVECCQCDFEVPYAESTEASMNAWNDYAEGYFYPPVLT